MMPFVSEVLENLICRLRKIFVWKAIVDEADAAYSLIKIDFAKTNHLPPKSVKLPTATKTFPKAFIPLSQFDKEISVQKRICCNC